MACHLRAPLATEVAVRMCGLDVAHRQRDEALHECRIGIGDGCFDLIDPDPVSAEGADVFPATNVDAVTNALVIVRLLPSDSSER